MNTANVSENTQRITGTATAFMSILMGETHIDWLDD